MDRSRTLGVLWNRGFLPSIGLKEAVQAGDQETAAPNLDV